MQDLGGGVGRGLRRLAGAVVAGLGGEVDAAVDGPVRQHGARLVSLTSRKHVCHRQDISYEGRATLWIAGIEAEGKRERERERTKQKERARVEGMRM